MKKITLLLGMAIATTMGFSQVIVDVVSAPTCTSLERTYTYRFAGELDGSATDWAMPNMFIGANSIQADVVLADDGSDGTIDAGGNTPHNKDNDACDSLTWTQDLTGKIAIFYRGACEFGLKGFNAQKRGAIGAIIVNHTGDAVGMAGGTYGVNVNIPYVMVSEDDGNALIACLENGGSLEVFIGSKVGLYPNDMGTSPADIVMAESTGNPLSLSQDSSELNLDLGIWAYNVGQNPMTGVTFTVDIDYMGSTIHTMTSAPLDFNAPDTSFVDTQYVDLGNYGRNPAWLTGNYTVTYTINTPVADDAPADNSMMSSFKVTADNVYAKARLDGSNEPIHTTAFSLNETTTTYDWFETCIQFKNPNASRLKAMGITYSCEPVGGTMGGELVEVRAYTWDDVFTDANDPAFPAAASPWARTQIGSGIDFYLDESEDGVNKYMAFDEAPINLVDNQRYLFCLYNASDSLRVGFDAQIDYTSTINNYLEFSSPVGDLPAGGTEEWYAAGFGYDVSTGISVNFDLSPTSVAEEANDAAVIPFPNPVANLLSIPVRKNVTGNVTVEVFDVAGKLVLTENSVVGNGPVRINVASIANGSYVFKTTFANGSTDSYKISVNR
jgi:PA domain-containing protein/type IX secretion system substrate protein